MIPLIPRAEVTYKGNPRAHHGRIYLASRAAMVNNRAPEAVEQLDNWEYHEVANRTFTIELKLDFPADDTERYNAAKSITMQAARDLVASTALLMPGDKSPSIAMFTEDHFFTQEQIRLFDANGEAVTVEGNSPIDDGHGGDDEDDN